MHRTPVRRPILRATLRATAVAIPGTAAALPDGPGRGTVEAVCTTCHRTNLIERSSDYDRPQWDRLIATMMDLSDDPDTREAMLDCLAQAFPPSDNRAATPVDGPLALRIGEWKVPTLGQRARDPVEAPDGSIRWVGQWLDILGRMDPATGALDLVDSPRAGSRPYGLKIAEDGTIWVSCNGANCLLRVDPDTMQVTGIPLPAAGTTVRRRDIDADGIIWRVNPALGRLGRDDPVSGDIREWASPGGAASHPYAIAVFDGAVWYNESAVRPDMLVRFDP